jgi:glycosyltransferase involved in cell wall biosynthesis
VSAGDGISALLIGMGSPDHEVGGLTRYIGDLCRSLREQGVDSRALVLGPPGVANPNGLTTVGPQSARLVARLVAFNAAAKRLGPQVDIVDSHFALYSAVPILVGPLRHKPIVVHFQGPWAEESRTSGETSRLALRTKRLVERAVYKRANQIVVLSSAFKRILVEHYEIAPWAVTVIPPGVDLERFTVVDRERARQALGLPPTAWVAMTARRLVPRTGVDELLRAWKLFTADFPGECLLAVAGEGPERQALEDQVAWSGLGGNVVFLGGVSDADLVRCYQAADICVVPSRALEGFGLVVLEALACGTPVMATDAGGLPEALAGLDRSLVVPRDDAAAMARRLLDAAIGARRLPSPEKCRRYAENFSWPAIALRTTAVYRAAASADGPRRPRVVFVDHCAQLSGGEIALSRLLGAMPETNIHVILAEDGPLAPMLTAQGLSVEVLGAGEASRRLSKDRVRAGRVPPAAVAQSLLYTLRLARRLRRLNPDLVHTNSLKASVWGGMASRLAGVPVIFHLRDRLAKEYLPVHAVWLMRSACRWLPVAVIANSHSTLATLGRPSALRAVRRTVIPDSVSRNGPAVRQTEPRGSEPLRVGIVGRLAPWKGQDVFLRAFAEAFPGGAEQAVIVGGALFGEDTFANRLPRLVESLGLSGRVEFVGFTEDVNSQLTTFDVLVHASVIPEPFGQVVLEGMAAGLPVVAAGAGGPSEIIKHGLDGLLYEPGNVSALAGLLKALSDDPAWRRTLGLAAVERSRGFSPEISAQQVVSLYHQVLAAGPDRPEHR